MKEFTSMTQDYFESGSEIENYLRDLRSYRSLVRSLTRDAIVQSSHIEALQNALQDHPQPVTATAHTEGWCGDWACNLPILRSLFRETNVPFRVFDEEHHPELKEHYRLEGTVHIPVVSLWDGEGKEIGRWVEAPETVTPLKTEWKERNPRLMELYAKKAQDPEAEKEFAKLYRKFLEDMSVWYRDEGKWNDTIEEIIALAEKGKK